MPSPVPRLTRSAGYCVGKLIATTEHVDHGLNFWLLHDVAASGNLCWITEGKS